VEVLLQQQLLVALQVRQGGGRATHGVSEWVRERESVSEWVDRGCGFELTLIVMLWCERVSEWVSEWVRVSSECCCDVVMLLWCTVCDDDMNE
jgi:hypothetical protein